MSRRSRKRQGRLNRVGRARRRRRILLGSVPVAAVAGVFVYFYVTGGMPVNEAAEGWYDAGEQAVESADKVAAGSPIPAFAPASVVLQPETTVPRIATPAETPDAPEAAADGEPAVENPAVPLVTPEANTSGESPLVSAARRGSRDARLTLLRLDPVKLADVLKRHPDLVEKDWFGRPALVNRNRCNVRSGPGTEHTVVTSVDQGGEVRIVGQEGDWFRVVLPGSEGMQLAWMYRTLLSPKKSGA